MTKRKMSTSEIEALTRLDVCIPEWPGGDSPPFSRGTPELYKPDDLKKKQDGNQTNRTDWFLKRLIGLSLRLGGPVPYAFTTANGELRSMDAGCLGFLWHERVPRIRFVLDNAGFVTHAALVEGACDVYLPLFKKFEGLVTPSPR
jgi:hypothetical protein